jgi:predicted phage terminase large subunit-like protein
MNDRALLYHTARSDFMTFARVAFDVVRPGVKFQDNWHLHAITTLLQEAETSRTVRQIVTLPPRSLKSFLISEVFPAWLLGRDPATRIICVTYGEKLSEELSASTTRIMQSDFYKRVFPATRLASETKLKLTTTARGMRFATSVGGPTTGFGGDWVIIDDPMNATDANSESAREAVKTYFDRARSSRVNDETASRFILVMQRLHPDDLAGHLLDKGGWNQLMLQAKATEPARVDTGGREMHEIRAGDLLHEARLPQSVLDRKLRDMGSANFQAQYQQDPVPALGNIVKRHWLRYYLGTVALDGGRIVLSLDTATKTDTAHDYSVCTVWKWQGEKHLLIEVWRDKVGYPELKAAIIGLYNRYATPTILIEDSGNGTALIQELRSFGIPVIARTATQNKISRFVSSTSYIEAGQMLLPQDASWLAEFEAEILGMLNVKHDDQADSLSQYFGWVRGRGPDDLIVHRLYDDPDPAPETLADVLATLPWY